MSCSAVSVLFDILSGEAGLESFHTSSIPGTAASSVSGTHPPELDESSDAPFHEPALAGDEPASDSTRLPALVPLELSLDTSSEPADRLAA